MASPLRNQWWMSSDQDDGLDWSAGLPATIDDIQGHSDAQVAETPFASANNSSVTQDDVSAPVVAAAVTPPTQDDHIHFPDVPPLGPENLQDHPPHNLPAHIGNDDQQLLTIVGSATQDDPLSFPADVPFIPYNQDGLLL